MLNRLLEREINAELVATTLFMIISFLYIEWKFGLGKILDTLFLWMFPASVMVFLTLLLVKIIERWSNRKMSGYRYVDWRKRV